MNTMIFIFLSFTLLLADVFENFAKNVLKNLSFRSYKFLSAPGFAQQAA